jgi:hypothetical protein
VVTGTLTVSPASVGLTLSLNGLWTGSLTLTADLGLALEQAQQREMVSSALAELDPGTGRSSS